MLKELGPGLRLTLILTLLTGLLYPAVMTGVSELIFPKQSNGSLVTVNGKVVGSSLIGQSFAKPEYFHPRPSAAGAVTTPPHRADPISVPPVPNCSAERLQQMTRTTKPSLSTALTFASSTTASITIFPMNRRCLWTSSRIPTATSMT